MQDLKYWLGFSLVSEIGPKRLAHLRQSFGELSQAWHASESHLRASGLEAQPLANLLQARRQMNLEREMEKVAQAGAWLVTLDDERYPELLRTLPDAPALLYVRGTLQPGDHQSVAVVGTRNATAYGRDAAYDFGKQLAQNEVTVISGLAHGIDTAAHRGALDGHGRTIAVLGNGIDQIYPRDNLALAAEITRHGALISEFPIGAPPEARNFPRRNRVISGLALGVLIVEAPKGSGALITATIAAEQGREVFAVPGNIFSPNSLGTNRLIQDGAKLVMQVEDVLNEVNVAHTLVQTKTTTERIIPDNDVEAGLLEHLSAEPIHVDELSRLCQFPIETVTSTLTILELKGLARKTGPMQYSLRNKR